METLVLDGKRYVKAAKAASDLGYTSDYVGQLCRNGHVRAHLVGRTWYVDEEQLGTHRVEKKRMARVKAREHAKTTLAEYRAQAVVTKSKKQDEAVHIRYEEDAADLLPPVRRLNIAIESEKPAARGKVTPARAAAVKPEPAYEVENPGEKIIMQGKLKLVDLNDGEQLSDENTVVLIPRINRKVPKPATRERVVEPLAPVEADADDTDDEAVVEITDDEGENAADVEANEQPRKTFAERMLAEGVVLTAAERWVTESDATVPEAASAVSLAVQPPVEAVPRASWWAPLLIIGAALALTVGMLGLESTADYVDTSKEEPTFQTGYTVNLSKLFDRIR